ncbi:hypothetical protein FLLO111716_13375 [Flavobacterium longum]|uniref:hypothetical protein n=1 Tax=Flavobacterium longum TaxID=1299340 RepID=UPI0039E9D8C4
METAAAILDFLDVHVIFSLLPLLVWLLLIERIFKNRFRTKQVIALVRWMVIGYTVVSTLFFIAGMIVSPDEFAFTHRATGRYAFAYWLMLICATAFPLTLLHRKLGRKPFYILLVVFLMKIGFYFERFVIITTSLHRDYAPGYFDGEIPFIALVIVSFLLRGFVLAVVLLAIFELLARMKSARHPELKN